MSLADSIHEKETELRLIKDHEIAIIFDQLGNIVLEEHGGASSVDLAPYIDKIRHINGATLVHNHPLGWQYDPSDPRHAGSSFSREDIETACYAEILEIRAVGPCCTYFMRPPADQPWNGNYWISEVETCLVSCKVATISSTLQLIKDGKISREFAEANFWHEVWLRLANQLPIVYGMLENE